MRQDGFTLLELLVSMTLLALLSLVLLGGFRFGTRAWDRSESATAGANEIRRAQDAIADTLGRAYPEMQRADPMHPHVYFDGRPGEVTYLGPTHGGAMAVYRLAREDGTLIMSATPELARDPRRQTRSRKLLGHVAAFELAYYGAARDDQPARWNAAWTNQTRLPRLVRIRARLEQTRPGWTEMMVTPHIEADQSCSYDAVAKFCQGR